MTGLGATASGLELLTQSGMSDQACDRQAARTRDVAHAAPGKRKPEGKEVAELPPAAVQAQLEIHQQADRGNLEAVGRESDDLRTAAPAKLAASDGPRPLRAIACRRLMTGLGTMGGARIIHDVDGCHPTMA